MINPEYELLGDGRSGLDRSRPHRSHLRSHWRHQLAHRCGASFIWRSKNLPARCPTRCPRKFWRDTNSLRGAKRSSSCIFRRATESVEALNSFRSQAHLRLIFEEFFFYQLSVAMRKKSAQQQAGIAFRVREPAIREAIKRVLPFKPTDAQKRALGGNRGGPGTRRADESPAAGRRRQRQNHCRAGSRDHRHRKRLPGRADGADGNSRRAAFSGRGKNIRARGLPRRIADQRNESIGEKSGARARAIRRSATRRGNARAARAASAISRGWAS